MIVEGDMVDAMEFFLRRYVLSHAHEVEVGVLVDDVHLQWQCRLEPRLAEGAPTKSL